VNADTPISVGNVKDMGTIWSHAHCKKEAA
jgi:hypothetical protein